MIKFLISSLLVTKALPFRLLVYCSLFAVSCSLLIISCGRKYNTQLPQQDIVNIGHLRNEIYITVNRELVEEDSERIRMFVEDNGWQMNTTASGLWYTILHAGAGEKAETGKVATLEYTISLLDSTVCYSSDQYGHLVFVLGRGGLEQGLEEGVLLLRVGDKARMVIPPHLAHGLTGDGDCIPQRATIIYEVELVGLSN